MKVTLIRHTSVNLTGGICYGQSNVDVSAGFEQEAAIVKSKLTNLHFDAVYSSPLQRCTKLARFCGYLQPAIDERLMELDFGEWEMQAWESIVDPHLQLWFDNWQTEKTPQGESFDHLINRVADFFTDLKKESYQHVAIFAHSGTIRAAGIICNRFDIENAFNFVVSYGDLFDMEI